MKFIGLNSSEGGSEIHRGIPIIQHFHRSQLNYRGGRKFKLFSYGIGFAGLAFTGEFSGVNSLGALGQAVQKRHGRDMEIEAINTFAEYIIKIYHQDCIISECGLVLDYAMAYNGASSGRLMSCLCYGRACVEIKIFNKLYLTK